MNMYGDQRKTVTPRHVYLIAAAASVIAFIMYLVKLYTSSPETGQSSTVEEILFIGSGFAILLSFINLDLSIILFIFVAPLVVYSIPNLTFFFTYGDAYLIILTIVLFGRLLTRREKRPISTYLDRYIFAFVVLSLPSLAKSRDVSAGFREIIQTLEYLVFCYYLFVIVVRNRSILESVIHALIVCSAIISFYGIIQYFQLGGGDKRIEGTFAHFNAMGTFTGMMTTFVFNIAIAEKNKRTKFIFYLALALNVIALLLSFSRGAWIGTILGIIISAQIRGMVQFIKGFAVISVMFFILTYIAPPRYMGRLASVPKIEDPSSKSRLKQWRYATDAISEYPLTGVGLSNIMDYVYEKYNVQGIGEIHNLYLHIGSERGLPAMIVFISIFVAFYINIIKRIRRTKDPYFSTIYVALFSTLLAYGVLNFFACVESVMQTSATQAVELAR